MTVRTVLVSKTIQKSFLAIRLSAIKKCELGFIVHVNRVFYAGEETVTIVLV